MAKPGYGPTYQRVKQEIIASGVLCAHCHARQACVPDHDPPLSAFPDPALWRGRFIPSCLPCSYSQGGRLGAAVRHRRAPMPSRAW
jgi:hypothetical protein